jgi:hypothetical protein
VRRFILALAVLFSASSAAAASELPMFAPGTPYPQARAELFHLGFRPQPAPYPDPNRCDEWAGFCAAYPEFVGCFVANVQPCQFLWRDPKGVLVEVDTEMGPGAPKVEALLVSRVTPMDPKLASPLFHARPDLPRFRMHTPYAEVRAGMIDAGYAPERVERRDADEPACWYDKLCATHPEVLHCMPTGVSFCQWIFRRRSDGRFVTVLTDGEPPQMSFNGVWLSSREDLKQAFGPRLRPHGPRPSR